MEALRGQQLLTELLCALVPAGLAPTATGEPLFPQLMPTTTQLLRAGGCCHQLSPGAGPSQLLYFDQDVVTSFPGLHKP